MSKPDQHKDALEACIDQFGLTRTIEMLSEVCDAKSEHVQSNWQDIGLAQAWDRASDFLQRVATRYSQRAAKGDFP